MNVPGGHPGLIVRASGIPRGVMAHSPPARPGRSPDSIAGKWIAVPPPDGTRNGKKIPPAVHLAFRTQCADGPLGSLIDYAGLRSLGRRIPFIGMPQPDAGEWPDRSATTDLSRLHPGRAPLTGSGVESRYIQCAVRAPDTSASVHFFLRHGMRRSDSRPTQVSRRSGHPGRLGQAWMVTVGSTSSMISARPSDRSTRRPAIRSAVPGRSGPSGSMAQLTADKSLDGIARRW